MTRKIRSDALYYRLEPEQREMLFEWLIYEGMKEEDAILRCAEEFGVNTSTGAISTFYKKHCFDWKMEVAKGKANDKATTLPKDFDAKKKAALAQREFEKAFNDLSTQEVIALQRLDLDRQIAKTQGEIELEKLKISRVKLEQKERDMVLARQQFQVKTCELFLKWYGDARAREITESGATNADKIERLGQAMFGEDWATE